MKDGENINKKKSGLFLVGHFRLCLNSQYPAIPISKQKPIAKKCVAFIVAPGVELVRAQKDGKQYSELLSAA